MNRVFEYINLQLGIGFERRADRLICKPVQLEVCDHGVILINGDSYNFNGMESKNLMNVVRG